MGFEPHDLLHGKQTLRSRRTLGWGANPAFQRALREHGSTERGELSRLVGARYWGPGMFRAALREALAQGGIRRLSRTTFAASDRDSDDRVDHTRQ
jgi:hypothetical protein